MDGILGQVGSRQLVPINRNILVGTVYWGRLVPSSLSRLSGVYCIFLYFIVSRYPLIKTIRIRVVIQIIQTQLS